MRRKREQDRYFNYRFGQVWRFTRQFMVSVYPKINDLLTEIVFRFFISN